MAVTLKDIRDQLEWIDTRNYEAYARPQAVRAADLDYLVKLVKSVRKADRLAAQKIAPIYIKKAS